MKLALLVVVEECQRFQIRKEEAEMTG